MTAHAKLSPSSASRWLHCPGSVQLCATLPKAPSSRFADHGTAAHALGERCLIEKCDAERYAKWWIKLSEKYGQNPLFLNPLTCKKVEGFEVDTEMVEAVQVYLDAVREPGGKIIPEQKLSLEHISPGMFGTADAQVLCEDKGALWVFDLKYGQGIAVDPEENEQAMLYALGSLGPKPLPWVKEVNIGIVQPRHRDGGVLVWETTKEYLLHWKNTVLLPGCAATTKKDAPLNPSDKACRWCNAKAVCPALLKNALNVAQVAFADIVPAEVPTLVMPNPANMTPDDRAKVATLLTALDDYKASFFTYLQELAERGEQTPGWKLVRGRANRKWISEDRVAATLEPILGDLLYDRKLKSPAGIEKIKGIDKKALTQLWETPEGKLTLAPVSDKRQAVLPDNPFNYDDL